MVRMDMVLGAKRHQATSPLAQLDRLAHDVRHSTRVGHLDGASDRGLRS
jgi:hypothetical protein